MRDSIQEQLRAADPLPRESGLSDAEVEAMRRAIAADAAAARRVDSGPRPAALAALTIMTAAIVLILAAGSFLRPLLEPAREPLAQPQAHEQRELQFETPGGTRVVWVLNSQFDLPEDRQQ
jgi:hypothetical protein